MVPISHGMVNLGFLHENMSNSEPSSIFWRENSPPPMHLGDSCSCKISNACSDNAEPPTINKSKPIVAAVFGFENF